MSMNFKDFELFISTGDSEWSAGAGGRGIQASRVEQHRRAGQPNEERLIPRPEHRQRHHGPGLVPGALQHASTARQDLARKGGEER